MRVPSRVAHGMGVARCGVGDAEQRRHDTRSDGVAVFHSASSFALTRHSDSALTLFCWLSEWLSSRDVMVE